MKLVTNERLVFGLVATAEKGAASAAFDALAAWMKEHGVEIERKAWPSYRALAESVREGSSDVAWLPPVVYAWLAEAVTPIGCIARGGSTSYRAALVALEESKIKSASDLKGARAGWVDPWSAAGYVVPRIELASAGVVPADTFATEKFYGTHKDALQALVRGECDVAGTYANTPDDAATPQGAWSQLDARIRVVTMFGSIPNDVIAVRRNLRPEQYELALQAFRRACADEASRPLVRAVFGGDELREGIEPGHDALRTAFERATANGLFD